MNKHVAGLVVFLMLMSCLIASVHAAQTFTVPPLSRQTIKVNLNQGDSIAGAFSVSGGTGTGVDFTVIDPSGKQLLNYNWTSGASFSFSASSTGMYLLNFDNSFCSCYGGKNVTLSYSIDDKTVQQSIQDSPYKGFPTTPTALVLSVAIVISILAVAILRGHRRQKSEHEIRQI